MEVCDLGFVERLDDPSQLTSVSFPSKLGGKPAWLDPQNLPSPEALLCGHCKTPLLFLLQVYAPLSDDTTFHRSVFLFMCRNPKCHQHNDTLCFKVFRCQLPEVNQFFSTDENCDTVDQLQQLKLDKEQLSDQTHSLPITANDRGTNTATAEVVKSKLTSSSVNSVASLCIVCGIGGSKRCAKCKQVSYCSKEHQIHDWKSGHKLFCPDLASGKSPHIDYDPSVGVTLPLFEIVTEAEPDLSPLESVPERSLEERMADYHKFVSSRNVDVSGEEASKKSKKCDTETDKKSDKLFKAFKKRVALEPEQVIRYNHGGSPLLVSCLGAPSEGEIPTCTCGAKRVFELQVLPQLLYHLKMDVVSGPSIDWGTLLIYTCSDSCSNGPAYHEETVWRQNFS